MKLSEINFGDVDAKNEILKQVRLESVDFFESYSIPGQISIDHYMTGQKYFVLGLKGTGKTALLRYMYNKVTKDGAISDLILFKSHVTAEDRQKLSNSAGFEIVGTHGVPTFVQDFKESWKWLIYQKIASNLYSANIDEKNANKLYKFTGVKDRPIASSLGTLFSKLSSGSLKISGEALGIALELGLEVDTKKEASAVSMSEMNRACDSLLRNI